MTHIVHIEIKIVNSLTDLANIQSHNQLTITQGKNTCVKPSFM